MNNAHHRIVVFSPHLDDAVLDASDHITSWKQQGYLVDVVTVFSAIRGSRPTRDMRLSSGIGGRRPREYEALRKKEDRKAMNLLKTRWTHFDFVEGGIREFNGKPVYPTFRAMLSGKVSPLDEGITRKIRVRMRTYAGYRAILIPLGIGGHVDHVIVQKAAESVFAAETLRYYTDYPYALSMRNWRLSHVFKYLTAGRSILPMSTQKRKILDCYRSQMPLLFYGEPQYREIVCGGALPTAGCPR